MFFWNSLAFSMIQRMLAIWSLVPLPFINPSWTSGSSWFTYWLEAWLGKFWALLCWHVRWVQSCSTLNILWHCFSLRLEWKLTFSSPLEVFQICWHIECSTFTASSFRIWNSSTGIPSSPLVLFVVMLPKAHVISHTRMSGSRWVITPSRLTGSWRFFLYCSTVFLPPLLNIFCFC